MKIYNYSKGKIKILKTQQCKKRGLIYRIQFSRELKIMSTSPGKLMITIEKYKFLNLRA